MGQKVCVIITTKDRSGELANALRSATRQHGDIEVLVVDDGSTDGTADLVRRDFPSARLERSERSLGYLPQRNRAATLTTADILVSIDDDAVFSTDDVVAQTVRDFDDPRIGAVAIPYVESRRSRNVRQKAPDGNGIMIAREFRGTAYAIRRDLFIRLGGFCELIHQQLEEQEFCARLIDAGYVVRLGRAGPIHHLESPTRDLQTIYYHQARSHLLFCWLRAPIAVLPLELLLVSARRWRRAARRGFGRASCKGVIAGLLAGLRCWRYRQPIRFGTWHLLWKLRRKTLPIDAAANMVPLALNPDERQ
jgi:glycosyltransferase involved in cell wall biosynthesis